MEAYFNAAKNYYEQKWKRLLQKKLFLNRESGIGRFKAGCADKAVEWFAGGKNHWGNDGYKVADKCSMVVRF